MKVSQYMTVLSGKTAGTVHDGHYKEDSQNMTNNQMKGGHFMTVYSQGG
jgi:hypothetical protein